MFLFRKEDFFLPATFEGRKTKGRRFFRNQCGSVLLLVLLSLFLNMAAAAAHRILLQQGIAEKVVRFHVLANSDSEKDQEIKYLVRDAVLEWLSEEMQEVSSGISGKEAVMQFLTAHLDEAGETANAVLQEAGVGYRATAKLCESYFPDRTYGEYTFPAGWYEALRICLGEADGQNWWCVLYPQLCFSDCLHAVIEDGQLEQLEGVLTVEEYESLLQSPGKWKIVFRWF